MVDGLDVKFALSFYNNAHFRDKAHFPRELSELRAQSIVGYMPPEHMKDARPWLSLRAREQLLSRVKKHTRSVDQFHQTGMLIQSIDEMPEEKPTRKRRKIRPHDFVTGAEIFLNRYPESTHWKPRDMAEAIARWYGITYQTMVGHIRRDGFFHVVKKLNRRVATRIKSLRSPRQENPMTPKEFVTFGREALTELQGNVRSTRELLTLIGKKKDYKDPYCSAFLLWNTSEFREDAGSIDEALVAWIEGIQCHVDALSMEQFIQHADTALEHGLTSAWDMLRFIGEQAEYASTPHLTAHRRYLDLHDKIQKAEPGLAALLDQELPRNQRRATWASNIDRIVAKPDLELCDDGELRTTSSALWFRTMSRSVLSRFVRPPAFVNRHVSYGVIY